MSTLSHTCEYCSNSFSPTRGSRGKFCSSSCSAKFNNSRRASRSIDSRSKSSKALQIHYHGQVVKEYIPPKPKHVYKEPKRKNTSFPHTKVKRITCPTCSQQRWVVGERKTCSLECARVITIRNGIRSNRSLYKNIWLDSNWELKLAKWLDNNNIEWIRPKCIPYHLDGKNKNYFPDFYLPRYDLYIDPKNPYRMKIDLPKMQIIETIICIIYGDLDVIIKHLERLAGVEPV
jgi:hypothetical protein